MYVAQASAVGDGTGGDLRIIFRFKTEGGPVSARFFNIEQISLFLDLSAETTKNCALNCAGFDRVGNEVMQDREWSGQLTNNTRSGITALIYDRLPPFPIFLGQSDISPGGSSSVGMGTDNVDTEVLRGTIQGYIWDPRSVSAEGGLQRPVQSLYG